MFVASEKMVKEPLISAWEAIIEARALMTMPGSSHHCGIMA